MKAWLARRPTKEIVARIWQMSAVDYDVKGAFLVPCCDVRDLIEQISSLPAESPGVLK
jgi:hypothetical protein